MKQLFGLIGHPVEGSKSPWVHECVFKHAQIDGTYLCFDLKEDRLEDAVKGLKALEIKGFNVTIPYKESVLPLLDEISPMAKQLGAVNTVKNAGGRLIGYNTDGLGLEAVLKRHLGSLRGLSVLVLGAGGAARGICGALLTTDIKLLAIENRSIDRAEALVASLNHSGETRAKLSQLCSDPYSYDLIINTTSVGMSPNEHASPIDLNTIASSAVVCDIVYKPHETQLIKNAKAKKMKVIYGIEMLIEQALIAESIWNDLSEAQLNEARQDLMQQIIDL